VLLAGAGAAGGDAAADDAADEGVSAAEGEADEQEQDREEDEGALSVLDLVGSYVATAGASEVSGLPFVSAW
jgi:hypothetical protein